MAELTRLPRELTCAIVKTNKIDRPKLRKGGSFPIVKSDLIDCYVTLMKTYSIFDLFFFTRSTMIPLIGLHVTI